MSLGFIMMCHTALDRAAQVARYWAEDACPVVIHVDRRTPPADYERLVRSLADLENVSFSRRRACEWGTWSLVAATQDAAMQLLQRHHDVRHFYLASGACLPLRPIGELKAYLDARPQTDFIESVTTSDVVWTIGGLHEERFSLRFPFSWKRRRRLFDRWTNLQRRLGVQRRVAARSPRDDFANLGGQRLTYGIHRIEKRPLRKIDPRIADNQHGLGRNALREAEEGNARDDRKPRIEIAPPATTRTGTTPRQQQTPPGDKSARHHTPAKAPPARPPG